MTEHKKTSSDHKFIIQRFYTKDISFEAPNTPDVFTMEWKPDMNLDVHTESANIGDDNFEVIVHLTVTVKSGDSVAFLVDVKQAGIFTITGFVGEELEHTLGCFCATNLYPYAREVVTDLVMKSGFPQLLLPPVNFEAIYDSKKASQTQSDPESDTKVSH